MLGRASTKVKDLESMEHMYEWFIPEPLTANVVNFNILSILTISARKT